MNAAILALLAIARSFGTGVLRCFVDGATIDASDARATVIAWPTIMKGNLLGRCKVCKAGVCYVDAVHAHVTTDKGRQEVAAIVSDRILIRSVMTGNYRASCSCGAVVGLKQVEGRYSKRHQCNAKCMSSTGPACECSCGGKNHGRSFS